MTAIDRAAFSVLLAHILEKPRAWVLAHPEAPLSPSQQLALDGALQRLASGVPLPYVLGHWEFYGLDLTITPDVLIPRPETELLVETALQRLRPGSRALDLGAGSGCIAVSLAVHAPRALITAADISPQALAVARANARRHNVAGRITFIQSDLFAARGLQSATFDVICANLPYIPTETLHALEIFGREPTLALDGGADGLALIRRFLAEAPKHLAPQGILLCEIEASQGDPARALARQFFPAAGVRIQPDLAGRDRLLIINLSPDAAR